MRLLLVDDDPEIRDVLSEYLDAVGHEVCCASSGREAIVLLANDKEPFDAALVDWQMAGISGRDLITHLVERYPATLVFVSTGHDKQVVSDRQLEGVAAGVFRKPYRLGEMVRAVQAKVDARASTRS
ncbi:MAG TPA: response regulator [Myxococcota bacterium]|nr:response regulator [Myxococcota bacterium]